MRTTKKVLLFMSIFILIFVIVMIIIFCKWKTEPTALIAGVLGTCGIEFIVNGWVRLNKNCDEIDLAEKKIKLLKKEGISFTAKDIFPSESGFYGSDMGTDYGVQTPLTDESGESNV
jgi:hypothetical protein